jgi:hypothetical protein
MEIVHRSENLKHLSALLCQQQPSVTREITHDTTAATLKPDSRNTPESTRYSSATQSGLSLSPHLALPAAGFTQPGPVPPASPEQEEVHVAPSRVSKSPLSRKLLLMGTYGEVAVEVRYFSNLYQKESIFQVISSTS